MKIPRLVWRVLASFAALLIAAGLAIGWAWLYLHPRVQRTDGVVYGERHGRKLALDVLRPARPNGFGVALMVSGGWKSGSAGSFQPWIAAPLLRRGYTIFAVYHVSQPEATVMEIVEDVNRAVRYIRYHAKEYGVSSQRLGVTGGSAGGHLSLMLATRGGPGPANATDPVDQESSAVQTVAIFYPVTDLLNLGRSTENTGDGGPPKSFIKAFGPDSTNLVAWKTRIGRDMSPIYFLNSNLPPTLIYHGDADTLVPLDQSQRFQAEGQKLGCQIKVVVHHGGKHGWYSMIWDLRRFGAWFDRYLRAPS
ncbi:MAG TPA: alpha/beta hydrolase [Verrucomicrobiae bacterium]